MYVEYTHIIYTPARQVNVLWIIQWALHVLIDACGRDPVTSLLYSAQLILGLRPANERRRYFVTTSLIGQVQA